MGSYCLAIQYFIKYSHLLKTELKIVHNIMNPEVIYFLNILKQIQYKVVGVDIINVLSFIDILPRSATS